ncbi:Xanthine/uracil permease [Basidiobolus meristosporus CBS 931.73]|uniref:Xanthine/uracil permease n=1 Tax=Basidiobolus meristosporus CBS 931.73 TaxID=1314790 RepID=A0A1Y1X655_9FUNG|nr:Xanthine/uracil permease [Basidiobolus meristosporus CBS 931.73]|eukprot:ORX80856.1 Xanthine/uracil permease [Basidiobolus meristosporus CBS 931.73]
MPRIPFLQRNQVNTSPFFGPDDEIPISVALLMGLQHFLAVIGGIISPTIMISGAGETFLNLDQETRSYMISASLMVRRSSIIQIVRFRIPRTKYFIGAGLLQITGVAFSNIPAAQAIIGSMYKNGSCARELQSDGTYLYHPCPDAFGAILGTQMLCAAISISISFLPSRVMRRIFPKIVTGVVLTVIGASLIISGMQNWAGGTGPCSARPDTGMFSKCPTTEAPSSFPWGSPAYIGLGASVFVTIIVVEMVGSIFLKNIAVVIGLAVGCAIGGAVGMFDSSSIQSAPIVTFLWVKTFKLSVYGPGVIPLLFVYVDFLIECIGDLTASCDVSGIAVEGPDFDSRMQGGLLADGLSGVLSGAATSMGVVTFSQNNGVIAVTRCASRVAGYVCAGLLIICGMFAKISGAFLAIPSPVMGGMTTLLFSSVATSGIRILAYLDWTRRDRIIVAASLALALGVELVPGWFSHVLPATTNVALSGFYEALETIASTGYILAGILSIVLNLTLPEDAPSCT